MRNYNKQNNYIGHNFHLFFIFFFHVVINLSYRDIYSFINYKLMMQGLWDLFFFHFNSTKYLLLFTRKFSQLITLFEKDLFNYLLKFKKKIKMTIKKNGLKIFKKYYLNYRLFGFSYLNFKVFNLTTDLLIYLI